MSRATTQERLAVKTPEAAFLHVLQEEFHFSPRVSRELLSTAKEMLVGGIPSSAVRPGQVRLVVTSMKAPFGGYGESRGYPHGGWWGQRGMSYPAYLDNQKGGNEMAKLEYVEGIGPAYAEKLRAGGINNTQDLLEKGATAQGRKELAEQTGISDSLILRWVNHLDLYRIKGIGAEYADLLEMAGVDTVPELAQRNAQNLYQTLVEVNAEKKLVRKMPTQGQVADWIEQAKLLPRVIHY